MTARTPDQAPQNLQHAQALNINDLQPGTSFTVHRDNLPVHSGLILASPDFDGDEWINGMAIIGPYEGYFDPYTTGVVPSRKAKWPEATYTLGVIKGLIDRRNLQQRTQPVKAELPLTYPTLSAYPAPNVRQALAFQAVSGFELLTAEQPVVDELHNEHVDRITYSAIPVGTLATAETVLAVPQRTTLKRDSAGRSITFIAIGLVTPDTMHSPFAMSVLKAQPGPNVSDSRDIADLTQFAALFGEVGAHERAALPKDS